MNLDTDSPKEGLPSDPSNGVEIVEHIFLGDYLLAKDMNWLKTNNIGLVINLTKHHNQNLKKEYAENNIEFGEHDLVSFSSQMPKILQKIWTHVTGQKNVLIHCAQGVMRSPAIIVAVLMERGMDLDSAIEEVQKKRPQMKMNEDYRTFLTSYFQGKQRKKNTEERSGRRQSPRLQKMNQKKMELDDKESFKEDSE